MRVLLILLSMAISGWFPAQAQSFPTKPIKLYVGFSAGGGGDDYARLLGQQMSADLGQPVVVENKPGASGSIAAELASKASPDGYTLFMATTGSLTALPGMRGKGLRYRVPEDFSFIGLAFEGPLGILVSAESKLNNLDDLMAAGRARGVAISYTGAAGAGEIGMELIKKSAKMKILDVPYPGVANVIIDILGGRIDGFYGNVPPLKGQIDAGKLKLIVLASGSRNAHFPNVGTFKEGGIDFVQTGFYGIVGPAGIPKAIVNRLSSSLSKALASTPVLSAVGKSGTIVLDYPQERFRAYALKEIDWYKNAMNSISPEVAKHFAP